MKRFNIYYEYGDVIERGHLFESEEEAIKYALEQKGISVEEVEEN